MGIALLRHRGSCITAQSSMQIKKKLKSVPKAIRSIHIKENAERRKSFLYLLMTPKTGIQQLFSFKNKEKEAKEKSASRTIRPACF